MTHYSDVADRIEPRIERELRLTVTGQSATRRQVDLREVSSESRPAAAQSEFSELLDAFRL